MRIIQIMDSMVFCVMPVGTMNEAREHYNFEDLKEKHGIEFVECENDNVKQQWIYNKETNKFTPPTPPEGWGYDVENGVFYELNPQAQYESIDEQKVAMAEFIVSMEG